MHSCNLHTPETTAAKLQGCNPPKGNRLTLSEENPVPGAHFLHSLGDRLCPPDRALLCNRGRVPRKPAALDPVNWGHPRTCGTQEVGIARYLELSRGRSKLCQLLDVIWECHPAATINHQQNP